MTTVYVISAPLTSEMMAMPLLLHILNFCSLKLPLFGTFDSSSLDLDNS